MEVKRTFARPSHKSNSQTYTTTSSSSTVPSDDTSNANSSVNPSGLPDSLKKFVGEAFDKVLPADKETMESQLRDIVTKSYEMGTTWSTDWSKATVPILEQRRKEKEEEQKRQLKQEKKNKKKTSTFASLMESINSNNIAQNTTAITKKAKKDTQVITKDKSK